MNRFRLSDVPVGPAALRDALRADEAGACVCFEGWVRNHHAGRAVLGLRYEAYRLLAETEGERILAAAAAMEGVTDVICVHRLGELNVGETAVVVVATAAHRDAAFAAARRVIDEIKRHVPIWKHERYADGDAQWIHPA